MNSSDRDKLSLAMYDFHRLMDGATKLKCSEFADAIIKHMGSTSAAPRPKPAMAGA